MKYKAPLFNIEINRKKELLRIVWDRVCEFVEDLDKDSLIVSPTLRATAYASGSFGEDGTEAEWILKAGKAWIRNNYRSVLHSISEGRSFMENSVPPIELKKNDLRYNSFESASLILEKVRKDVIFSSIRHLEQRYEVSDKSLLDMMIKDSGGIGKTKEEADELLEIVDKWYIGHWQIVEEVARKYFSYMRSRIPEIDNEALFWENNGSPY